MPHTRSRAVAEGYKINTGDGQDTADVVAASALYFPHDVQGQFKSDFIYSTLFAQLAADHKYDRWDDFANWYNNYKEVLGMLGWATQNSEMFEMGDVGTYGSIAEAVIQLSVSLLIPRQFSESLSLIGALKESRNETVESIFNQQSRRSKAAHFQFGIARMVDGNPTLVFQQYLELSSEEIGGFLFDRFGDEEVNLKGGNQTMLLNGEVYGGLRKAVLDRLSIFPLNTLIQAIEL